MGTSGGSYPSRVCSGEVGNGEIGDYSDDEEISPPGETLSRLREKHSAGDSLLSISADSSTEGIFGNDQQYGKALNHPQRFDFSDASIENQAELIQFAVKQGIYFYVSNEYARFKAIVFGVKFLNCLYQTEDAKKCLYSILAKEVIKGTLENVSETLSESVTNVLWDGIEDEFIERGISPENLRPIRQAFQSSMQKGIDNVLEKGTDKAIDISYEYIEDFLSDTDMRFQFKDATSNPKSKFNRGPRRNHYMINNQFVSNTQMNNYKRRLAKHVRKNYSGIASEISSHNEQILEDKYSEQDYLKDVKNEDIRGINTKDEIIYESDYDLKDETNHLKEIAEYHINPEGEIKDSKYTEFGKMFQNGKFPTILKDLLTIADYLHYFDCYIKRNTKEKKDQRYVLRISTPLADFWNTPEVKYRLKRAIYELMEENVVFRFLKKDETVVPMPKVEFDESVINLFSGGLDSLSGAINVLKEDKVKPRFVSIRKRNTSKEMQQGMIKRLAEKFDKDLEGFEYTFGYGNKGSAISREERYYHPTQRSRSFLYLTVALIFGISKGSRRILIHENGVISVLDDVPFVQSERFTRTVHPEFIEAFNLLVKSISSEDIIIENPYATYTKTEIINKILENSDEEFALEVIKTSESCSNTGNRYRGLKSRYCGSCTPCVLKTLAIMASKIDFDKLPSPQIDIFQLEEITNEPEELKGARSLRFQGELTLRDIYYLAGKIKTLSKNELIDEFPIFRNEKFYKMFKRFSKELLAIELNSKKYPHFNELQKKVIS